jgi:hypothetical protein
MNLSLKDKLHESMHEDSKKSRNGIPRRKAYHRFFEGYSEITVPKSNGKGTRIERIYTGNYYRQDLTKRQRILIRMLYVGLFLIASILYTSSAIQPLMINSTWYVVLSEAGSLVFLFWILIAFISYLPAAENMTIEDYRSSSLSLKKATFGGSICLGITVLTMLVFIILNPSLELQKVLFCLAKYLMGGLVILSMNRIEWKVNYLIIPSQNKSPENGFEIS